VSGVVLGSLNLRWLREHLDQRRAPGARDVLVTDDHGTVLTRVGEVRTSPGENLGREGLVETTLGRREGTLASAVGSKRRLYGFTSVSPL
jgi:hypothetical protein